MPDWLAILKAELAAIKAVVDTILTNTGLVKTQTDKLAGVSPITGQTAQNWQAAEAGLVTINPLATTNKLHSLLISMHNLVGTSIIVRMYMEIFNVERLVYRQTFDATVDPPGLWIVNGTVGIHEALRVTLQSNNAADNGQWVHYDYMLEEM